MKSSTISLAFLHLASLCYGAPGSAYVKARQEGFEATITFQGAGPNPPEYTLTVPCDESTFTTSKLLSSVPLTKPNVFRNVSSQDLRNDIRKVLIPILDNPLSVSHIIANDTRTCLCTFNGIDGSITTMLGDGEVDVGPPQTQVSGNCGAVFPPRRQRAVAAAEARQVIEGEIRFLGAGPNPPEYDLNVPCDGSTFFTSMLLSFNPLPRLSIHDAYIDVLFYNLNKDITKNANTDIR